MLAEKDFPKTVNQKNKHRMLSICVNEFVCVVCTIISIQHF